jgi:hypothetical protein
MVVLSPAGAPQALAVLHPCPVDNPTAVTAHHMPGAHSGHHGVPASEHESCTCIGGCTAPMLMVPSEPGQLAIASVVPSHAGWSVIESRSTRRVSLQLHPPQTAPPQA